MTEQQGTEQQGSGEREELQNRRQARFLRRPHAMGVLLAFVVLAAIASVFVWRYYATRETTDDAQVEAHIHPVSPRVSGTVIRVNFSENQYVKAGAVLVVIDPKDYQVALEKAQADLAQAEAALHGSQIDLPITALTTSSQLRGAQAGVQEAQANLASSEKEVAASQARLRSAQAHVLEAQANYRKAEQDLDRMKRLIAKQEISQQQYDTAVAAATALQAAVDSAQADVGVAKQNLRAAQSHVVRDRARVQQAQAAARAAGTAPQQVAVTKSREQSALARVQMAKAAVDQAQLNLQYTIVRAPVSGVASKKNVETGQVVAAGQPLLAVVPLDDIWVNANFKETQLDHIRPGQRAVISVDAYGGRKYKGYVDSIAAATGAKFSLLPPENATGNYVKVVQRVPVKILLDKGEDSDKLLRPGMSVEPTVFTK